MENRNGKCGRSIVLIGFMGSGKTTVGIRLSYKWKMPFLDTDKLIEQREGRTVSEIFATEGEAYFRSLETGLLKELAAKPRNQILSAGGGTPVREENRKLLKKLGSAVYLRARPQTVYERLKGDTARPLLQGKDPLSRITELLEERSRLYEEAADFIIDVDERDIDGILEEIGRIFL